MAPEHKNEVLIKSDGWEGSNVMDTVENALEPDKDKSRMDARCKVGKYVRWIADTEQVVNVKSVYVKTA